MIVFSGTCLGFDTLYAANLIKSLNAIPGIEFVKTKSNYTQGEGTNKKKQIKKKKKKSLSSFKLNTLRTRQIEFYTLGFTIVSHLENGAFNIPFPNAPIIRPEKH